MFVSFSTLYPKDFRSIVINGCVALFDYRDFSFLSLILGWLHPGSEAAEESEGERINRIQLANNNKYGVIFSLITFFFLFPHHSVPHIIMSVRREYRVNGCVLGAKNATMAEDVATTAAIAMEFPAIDDTKLSRFHQKRPEK